LLYRGGRNYGEEGTTATSPASPSTSAVALDRSSDANLTDRRKMRRWPRGLELHR